jgi:hypothetical protein
VSNLNDANIKAYIEVPSRESVFAYLDACINPDVKKRAFLTSVAGAGRTRLLETWANRSDHPGTILMIELQAMPQMPIFNVACSLLWYQILLLDARLEQRFAVPRKPTVEEPEAWFSHRRVLNLYHHHIIPAMDYYQVIAIVIDNARLLDKSALSLMLDLEYPANPWQRSRPTRSLIFGMRMLAQPAATTPFVKAVQGIPRLRLPWNERKHLGLVDTNQFFHIWAKAMAVNLRAQFDESVGKDERNVLIATYAQRTSGSWWGIEDLIQIYHEELGGFRNKPYRSITHEVIKRVGKRLEKLDWTVLDEEEQKKSSRSKSQNKAQPQPGMSKRTAQTS